MSSVSEQVLRFVERVPRLRRIRGMTQAELAEASGLSRQAISKIEVGERGVSLADALAICQALAVPIDDMTRVDRLVLAVDLPVDDE